MTSELKPRLCLMVKGETGYGFHLHGEKGKSGQFIRKVEPGSPAEASGLRAGDRVVAVNGANVEKETHHQASRCAFICVLVPCRMRVYQQVTPAGASWHCVATFLLTWCLGNVGPTVCPHETTLIKNPSFAIVDVTWVISWDKHTEPPLALIKDCRQAEKTVPEIHFSPCDNQRLPGECLHVLSCKCQELSKYKSASVKYTTDKLSLPLFVRGFVSLWDSRLG